MPRTAQARAETTNGAGGISARHRSRRASRRSGSRPATCTPAGPTPYVNGSHQSSNVRCSTSTEIDPSSTSASPASSASRSRSPRRAPGSRDSSTTSGSSSRAASQKCDSGPPPPAWSHTQAPTTPPGQRHTPHLAQPGDGVGHEVDDELGEGDVEGAVGERQAFGGCRPHVDPGVPRARSLHESLRRVDGRDGSRGRRVVRARSTRAPGPHPTSRTRWPGRDRRQVGEEGCERHRVPPHEPVVGLCSDGEAHALWKPGCEPFVNRLR